jgi:hypothetical protein
MQDKEHLSLKQQTCKQIQRSKIEKNVLLKKTFHAFEKELFVAVTLLNILPN